MSVPPQPSSNGHTDTLAAALSRLLPRHLIDLRKSGLSDEQIAACGFTSFQAPETIQKVLRWRRYRGELGPCLAIPFFDASGQPTGYDRLKPDRPRAAKGDGKPIKYESPKGSSNLPYLPPWTRGVLQDVGTPLVITEGEKKAAKADQERFACVGLVGVYGWQKKRAKGKDGEPQGERELIPGLVAIPWNGRLVYLCFDSDAASNPNVRRAEWHLAEVLARHGAAVKVIRLPPGDPGPDGNPVKVGLDDYLVAHGPAAFRDLLAAASDPESPVGVAPIEAADDPHRLARLFVAERCQHADGLTLRYWSEEWLRWDGSRYRVLADKELRAEQTQVVKAEMDRLNLVAQKLAAAKGEGPPPVRKVTGRMIADVAHALASLTMLPSRTEPPAWVIREGPFPAAEVLACRNGLVHLPSLVTEKDHFAPPTPGLFSRNCLDFDFRLDAPRPAAWLDFMARLWADDSQSICTLQDWLGYLLTSDTRQQKILLLVGPKRSGKGTIARVIRGLLGPDNVAGPTLSSLGTNFGLWPLLGKSAAIVSDARLSGRTDTATVTERLLSISGEDPLTVDRKNLSPVTVKIPARIILLTNELPRLGDASGALTGRMIVLRLCQSWYGKEDVNLTDRLLTELPGILLWAIAGWQRLSERGHFVQPDAGKELLGELEDLSSPIGAFVRECCLIGPGHRAAVADLFAAWRAWCEEKGRKEPGTEATFGRDLLAAAPALRRVRPRDGEERYRAYEGIGLRC
jgi:putative DNA primase/helicase